jgi:septal ring factor EnvC (AmiA/AmiB activator)
MIKLYLLLLIFCFSSCVDNSSKVKDKLLIELNESKQNNERLKNKLHQLEDELDNCKLNYKALDEATDKIN